MQEILNYAIAGVDDLLDANPALFETDFLARLTPAIEADLNDAIACATQKWAAKHGFDRFSSTSRAA